MTPKVLAFITQETKHPQGTDYVGLSITEDGEILGTHIGSSPQRCYEALKDLYKSDYANKFPDGYEFEWVPTPSKDPRIAAANKAAEERAKNDPTRFDEQVFDALGTQVEPGWFGWEPVDRSKNPKHPISLIPPQTAKIHFGRGAMRIGDPMLPSLKENDVA